MNQKNEYMGLNFEKRKRRIPKRVLHTFIVPAIFIIIWISFSPNQLWFPLLLILIALCWISTYGWDEAYSNLIHFTQRYERH